jgi:hypothetical protein
MGRLDHSPMLQSVLKLADPRRGRGAVRKVHEFLHLHGIERFMAASRWSRNAFATAAGGYAIRLSDATVASLSKAIYLGLDQLGTNGEQAMNRLVREAPRGGAQDGCTPWLGCQLGCQRRPRSREVGKTVRRKW